MGGEEMATDTVYVCNMEGSTKFVDFCQRHNINPNLIMLKITLFVMYGGELRQSISFTYSIYYFPK